MKHLHTLIPILFLAACSATPVILETPSSAQHTSTAVESSSSASSVTVSSQTTQASTASIASEPPAALPASVRITMPFTTQAPLGNWDMPYQEACEEASLLIVQAYLNQSTLSPESMDRGIMELVAAETSLGLPPDITIAELARIAETEFHLKATIYEESDITVEQIEQLLAQGLPIIVPLAGQLLGNPYYSGDGPPYHMLVINGYNRTQFLTHDVGTKRGAYYPYNKDLLLSAIHDWTGNTETIQTGAKRMLVLRRTS